VPRPAVMAELIDEATWRLATTDAAVLEATASPMTNGTPASPPSSSDSVFQSIDRYVTPVWYVLGIPGNLLAYCVWMQPKMRRSSGVYLASLALDECLFLIMQVIQPPHRLLYALHCVSKKRGVELFAITSSTVNRF